MFKCLAQRDKMIRVLNSLIMKFSTNTYRTHKTLYDRYSELRTIYLKGGWIISADDTISDLMRACSDSANDYIKRSKAEIVDDYIKGVLEIISNEKSHERRIEILNEYIYNSPLVSSDRSYGMVMDFVSSDKLMEIVNTVNKPYCKLE